MKRALVVFSLMLIPAIVWAQHYDIDGRIAAQEFQVLSNSRDPIIFADGNRRPTDTNVDLFIHGWEESTGHTGHGGFIEHPYFTHGDPMHPTTPGAVLKYIKEYNHGILTAGVTTDRTENNTEQAVFFVLDGEGTVTAGGETVALEEGVGVFIPAGLAYQFENTGDDQLEVVIVTEETGSGFEPLKKMITTNYHDIVPTYGGHWCHVVRTMLSGAKYYNPLNFLVVSIETIDMAHPHAHVEGAEEIWNQFKGESLLSVGKYLRHQAAGTAFLAPPDSISAHSSINYTGEPQYWFYTSIRYDTKR